MSLIKPEIAQLLRTAGINSRGSYPLEDSGGDSISSKLDSAGLSIMECFGDLRNIITTGDSDTVKLNAIKTVLEAHRVMKGDPAVGTVVNIIINDNSTSINPMLLPRQLVEMHSEG